MIPTARVFCQLRFLYARLLDGCINFLNDISFTKTHTLLSDPPTIVIMNASGVTLGTLLPNNNNCNNYKTSIAPISLRRSSSEVQQKNNLACYTRGEAIVVIGAWNLRKDMVEKQYKITFL